MLEVPEALLMVQAGPPVVALLTGQAGPPAAVAAVAAVVARAADLSAPNGSRKAVLCGVIVFASRFPPRC